jgi:hypothetical protein
VGEKPSLVLRALVIPSSTFWIISFSAEISTLGRILRVVPSKRTRVAARYSSLKVFEAFQ